jgi:hypothetical protein
VSPKPPVSIEKLRALRQFSPSDGSPDTWHSIPGKDKDLPARGFPRQHIAAIAMGAALALALGFLAWTFWVQYERLSRDLDQTKLALTAANDEVAKVRANFAQASIIHDLWGMGSQFATASAAACRADDDKKNVREATTAAIEMWSDSKVRSEIDLEQRVLPVFRQIEKQGVHVVGASLPAGVVAQYRRFLREGVGDVVMLDKSRIVDSASRMAAIDLLRRAAQGELDPAKTHVVYRHDEYGRISYPLVQGPADASMLRAKVSDDPLAEPVTITATDYPCS